MASARHSLELTGRESASRRHVRPRIWTPPPQMGCEASLPDVRPDGDAALARHALHGDGCHLYLGNTMGSFISHLGIAN